MFRNHNESEGRYGGIPADIENNYINGDEKPEIYNE